MITSGFSVKGASLRLLRAGERGVITRIHALQEATAQKLREMGLVPGQTVILEQRFPRFIIRAGGRCHGLDEATMNAIYVRLVEH